jgi:hypothetical protein
MGNNPYATANGDWDDRSNFMLGDLASDEDHLFDGKEVERDARARDVAVRYIIENPSRTLVLVPRRLLRLYLSDVDGIYFSMGTRLANSGTTGRGLYRGLRAAGEVYYFITVIMFAVSMPKILGTRRLAPKVGVFMLVYLTSVYALFFGLPRYHFPLMPWVAMYAGIGGEQLLRLCNIWVRSAASGGPNIEPA